VDAFGRITERERLNAAAFVTTDLRLRSRTYRPISTPSWRVQHGASTSTRRIWDHLGPLLRAALVVLSERSSNFQWRVGGAARIWTGDEGFADSRDTRKQAGISEFPACFSLFVGWRWMVSEDEKR